MDPVTRSVHTIAWVMLDWSDEARHALLCDAFEHAMRKRPELYAAGVIDARITVLVADIYRAIARMEREHGHA